MTSNVQDNESYATDDPNAWPIVRQLSPEHDLHDIAIANAVLWLTQASRGEVPSGGVQ
jgi:hypothetical protein